MIFCPWPQGILNKHLEGFFSAKWMNLYSLKRYLLREDWRNTLVFLTLHFLNAVHTYSVTSKQNPAVLMTIGIIGKSFPCLGLSLIVSSWPHGPEKLKQSLTDAKIVKGKKAIKTMTNHVVLGSSDRKLLQAVSGLWSLGPECLSVNNSRKWGQELCSTHWEPIKTQTRSYRHLYTDTHAGPHEKIWILYRANRYIQRCIN